MPGSRSRASAPPVPLARPARRGSPAPSSTPRCQGWASATPSRWSSRSGRPRADATSRISAAFPFLIKGETAWLALANLTEAEQETYLADRAARGFNLVEVMLTNHDYTRPPNPAPPANRRGEQPFLRPGDLVHARTTSTSTRALAFVEPGRRARDGGVARPELPRLRRRPGGLVGDTERGDEHPGGLRRLRPLSGGTVPGPAERALARGRRLRSASRLGGRGATPGRGRRHPGGRRHPALDRALERPTPGRHLDGPDAASRR